MLPEIFAGTAAGLVLYHHFAYPILLRALAARLRGPTAPPLSSPPCLPTLTLVVPAHNEAAFIARKIQNIFELDYPRERLSVVVVCDGCTDGTVAIASRAIRDAGKELDIQLVTFESNLGKVARINHAIADVTTELVALTDTSALLSPDALLRLTQYFVDDKVGVVCPTYRLSAARCEGERAYWSYQCGVKADEAAFGAPIGAHGAFYMFRRDQWDPLPPEAINDDVILPMRIVAKGFRAVYVASVAATELETTQPAQEWRRRVRIGAGNLQQVVWLRSLMNPVRPGLAFVFFSGKTLRVMTPFLCIIAALATLTGALSGNDGMLMFLALQIALAVLAVAACAANRLSRPMPRVVAWLGYIAEGYTASFVGSCRFMLGYGGWGGSLSIGASHDRNDHDYIPRSVVISKRIVDIVCGLGALAVLIVVFVPVALLIKLESPGPIFYRQLRVGRITPNATYLFYLIKFRTMRADAEAKSGAVWASKNDPRVTRFGLFMRKTRLDELPQCFNVLCGEMSVVGPRPERSSFFSKLEDAIPFYAERTYGLKPGITGLAQINQAYDSSIEDVRNKVLYDHAYAARISTWTEWMLADFGICIKTFTVMALGKGQ